MGPKWNTCGISQKKSLKIEITLFEMFRGRGGWGGGSDEPVYGNGLPKVHNHVINLIWGICVGKNLGSGAHPPFWSMLKSSMIFLSENVSKGWRLNWLRFFFRLPDTLADGSCQYITTLPTRTCIRRDWSYCSMCCTPQVNWWYSS